MDASPNQSDQKALAESPETKVNPLSKRQNLDYTAVNSSSSQNSIENDFKTWKQEIESKIEKIEKLKKLTENENNVLREAIRRQSNSQREIQLRHQKVFFFMYEMLMRRDEEKLYIFQSSMPRSHALESNEPMNQSQMMLPSSTKEYLPSGFENVIKQMYEKSDSDHNFAKLMGNSLVQNENLNPKTTFVSPSGVDQALENEILPSLRSSFIESLELAKNEEKFQTQAIASSQDDTQIFDDLPPLEYINTISFNHPSFAPLQGNKRMRGLDFNEFENPNYNFSWESNSSRNYSKQNISTSTKRRKFSNFYEPSENEFKDFELLDSNPRDLFDYLQSDFSLESDNPSITQKGDNFDQWNLMN